VLPQTDTFPAFAHGIDPVLFCEDRLRFFDGRPFIPDRWQADLLRSDAPQVILNIGRQSGKSTAVAALAIWTALYHPGALIVLISPSLRQSGELMLKCREFLRALGPSIVLPEDNKLSATLANNSRIVALPGDNPRTIRGFSAPALVVEDESAFVRDETHAALIPMLAASQNGRLILMSTPWLRLGHFHSIWQDGENWERYEVPTSECRRVRKEWLAERKREDPLNYGREYECQFASDDDGLFTAAMLDRMECTDFEPLAL
jgi:hypothetical protein